MSFRVFDHYYHIIDILSNIFFKYTNLCKTAKESRRIQYLNLELLLYITINSIF
jgi:hypothetical protein